MALNAIAITRDQPTLIPFSLSSALPSFTTLSPRLSLPTSLPSFARYLLTPILHLAHLQKQKRQPPLPKHDCSTWRSIWTTHTRSHKGSGPGSRLSSPSTWTSSRPVPL